MTSPASSILRAVARPAHPSATQRSVSRSIGGLASSSTAAARRLAASALKMSGQGFVWPIGVQQRNYQIFDTTLLKPETAQFVGTSTVDGLNVYVFVENVNNKQFGSVTLPGSLAGISDQPTVTLPEYLSSNNTYYVDPGTGSPLKIVESQNISLVNPSTGATASGFAEGHAHDDATEHCRGRQHGEVVGQ